MAITKTIEIGKVEVVGEYKAVQVRTDTIIKEDGVDLSRTYHRHVLHPGTLNDSDALVDTDISAEDAELKAICELVWTDSVRTAWKDKLIADKAGPEK